MKTHLKNVVILNLLNATPEAAEQVARVDKAVLALVTPETKALLTRINIGSVMMTLEVPAGTKPLMVNGEHTLSGLSAEESIALVVNGQLILSEDLSPKAIQTAVAGGVINGVIYATREQMAALSSAGVMVNGSSFVYPEGTKLRLSKEPLTLEEASALKTPVFLARRVPIERGACDALAQRGLAIYGNRGAFIHESDAAAFFTLWQGEGPVAQIPDGYTLMRGNQTITRRSAPLLRDKRYIAGDLYLREDVDGASLSALKGLMVHGKLFMPEALLGPLLSVLDNEPELMPYVGTLLSIDGVHAITSEAELPPDGLAICVDGVLEIAPDIAPEALRSRITLLYVDGVVRMTPAQHMALLPALQGPFHIEASDRQDAPDDGSEEDMRVVENLVMYTL